jgi:hypothetical protein
MDFQAEISKVVAKMFHHIHREAARAARREPNWNRLMDGAHAKHTRAAAKRTRGLAKRSRRHCRGCGKKGHDLRNCKKGGHNGKR